MMKKLISPLSLLLATVFVLFTLAGCSTAKNATDDSEPTESAAETDSDAFSYSDGIGEDGYFMNINAKDYVQLCSYMGVTIPSDKHQITDEAVQEQIDTLMANYATKENVTDRAVKSDDTLNIDYVGTVNGEAFDGGSTNGAGTEVIIGTTQYIDDFLEQLIGHTPGETFDVNVTFPADYGVDTLNGKDAVFAVTINYIVKSTTPELTDSFVSENMATDYGWTTVTQMKDSIKSDLQNSAIADFMQAYIVANSTVTSLPDALLTYQENSMVTYYQSYADNNSMTIEDVISANFDNCSTVEDMLQASKDDNTKSADFSLIIQAIAKDAGITVSDEDVAAYFKEYVGTDDYSKYEDFYGMPYLKYMVLNQKVMDLLKDNAVLA